MDQTVEQKPIANEIELAFQRIQSRCQNSEPKAKDNTDEVLKKLQERGYPRRHCQFLRSNELRGPGGAKARELYPRVKAEDGIFLLTGDRGPGKTQIATAWAFWRGKEDLQFGYYVKHSDLMAEIKSTWGDGGKKSETDVLKRYRKTPFLVIDEMQEKGDSDWESRMAVNIIDHRYDNMLMTIMIANYSEADIATYVNKSILSRCQETGGHVVCAWPSYREGR